MSIIFGNKIRTLREEKQIPQRQLAAALEIDTATYCKIEKGDGHRLQFLQNCLNLTRKN